MRMGYMLSTQSGTVYTVLETERPGIMTLFGGKFPGNAIYQLDGLMSEGLPF